MKSIRMIALVGILALLAVSTGGVNSQGAGPADVGSVAATVAAAKAMGAEKGHLLEYTTSHDVMTEGEFDMAVGYAGIVF